MPSTDSPTNPSTSGAQSSSAPFPTTTSSTTPAATTRDKRLIVVSNRLPVTIAKDKNGQYTYKMSSGGLVSALSGCKKTMTFTWIGWPGQDVSSYF